MDFDQLASMMLADFDLHKGGGGDLVKYGQKFSKN